MFLTLETSLKFDPSIKQHENRQTAVAYAVDLLVKHGWPRCAAIDVIEAEKPALIEDDGNDWTIELRNV